jgi:hypothetical protein
MVGIGWLEELVMVPCNQKSKGCAKSLENILQSNFHLFQRMISPNAQIKTPRKDENRHPLWMMEPAVGLSRALK